MLLTLAVTCLCNTYCIGRSPNWKSADLQAPENYVNTNQSVPSLLGWQACAYKTANYQISSSAGWVVGKIYSSVESDV